MSTEDTNLDNILDRAISEVRDESIDPAAAREAADRVWARVSGAAPAPASADAEILRTCADFQALIPAWRQGQLSSDRGLLVEDHLHECPACRRAFSPRPAADAIPIRKPAPRVWKWAVAAAVVIAAGLSGYLAYDRLAPSGPAATVYALDGTLYRTAAGARLAAGAPIAPGETVRTGKDAGAVIRLRDGSLVELRERTELALASKRDGATIDLAGGSVIVQAAKQRRGHLYVSTADCLVSVTGTVFAVDNGVKGSRVSVLEGEVRVAQGNSTSVLHPGDQLATGAAMTPVSIRRDIAWSRDFDRHVALLNEFLTIQKKLEAAPGPGLRYSSKLLALAPKNATFYAAIPNLGPTVSEANRLFHEQLAQSEVLRQWWSDKLKTPENQAKFDDALTRFREFSDYLGQEIVITLAPNPERHDPQPLLMAEVIRPGLRAFIEDQIAKLKTESQGKAQIRIIDDPAAATSAGHELLIYLTDNVIALSPNLAPLRELAAATPGPQTDFQKRIAEAYSNGVTWLFCADMHAVTSRAPKKHPEQFEQSGFADMRYLVVERKDVGGKSVNHATLSFSQTRHGVASWLAAPAPIRALDYISPDASLAVAFIAKNPSAMFDDVSSMAGAKLDQGVAMFQAFTGVNPRTDLAALLGGEVAFAIDGPMLPQPSWKLILEVNDPAHFVATLQKLTAAASQHSQKQLNLTQEIVGGRTYYTLSAAGKPFSAQFTFEDGLLIAAPSRDLITRALQLRSTGYTLTRSAKFKALLPADGHVNFSGMVYHALGDLLAPLAAQANLTPDQRKVFDSVAPALVLVYGEPDQIEVASAGSFFGLQLEELMGLAAKRHRQR